MKDKPCKKPDLKNTIAIAMLFFCCIYLSAQAPVVTSNGDGGNNYTFNVSAPGNLKIALTNLKSTISFTSGQKDNFIIIGELNSDDTDYFASNIGGWTANSLSLNKFDLSQATVSALRVEQFDGTKSDKIKEIILPNTLSVLPHKTFAGCTSITRGAGVTSIGTNCYSWARWSSLGIFDAKTLFPVLTTLQDNAFAYNDNNADFTGIILPATFTAFGNNVFADCPKLASITLYSTTPPALGSIGNRGSGAAPITLYVPGSSVDDYKAISGYSSYFGVNNIKANPYPTPIISFGVSSPYYKSYGDAPFTIAASSNSDGQFTYSSSNELVATINSTTGQITIQAPGTTVITVDQAAGSGGFETGTASFTLTVRPLIYISDNQTSAALGNSDPDVVVTATGNLTIDAATAVHNITIEPKGRVTLNSGVTLTVNQININSNSEGTGTFVDKNSSGANYNGNVQQYLTYGRNWYISSPITYAYTANLWNLGSYVTKWSEPDNEWQTITDYWGQLSVGKGYLSVANGNTGNTSINFSGTLNNTQVQIPLTRRETVGAGFNLVGNPYPSYLDWSLVSADNPDIMSTMWFRTKTTGNTYTFSTVNGIGNVVVSNDANTTISKFIPPMQAFWVRVNPDKTTATLTMTNAMRSHSDYETNKFKVKATENKLIRLQVTNGVNSDETVIYFNENAQDGFDNYDSQKRSNNNVAIPEIYTKLDNEQLVINGMCNLKYDTEIPLGFKTGQQNSFTLKLSEITNFDGKVLLKDNSTGQVQDLTQYEAYTFDSEAITTESRFSIIFRTTSSVTKLNSTSDDAVLIYKNNENNIVIKSMASEDENLSVSLFNESGQQLMQKNAIDNVTTLDITLKKGVYIVKINKGARFISCKSIII